MAGFAADVRTGKVELLPLEMNEKRPRLDLGLDRLAVDGQRYLL